MGVEEGLILQCGVVEIFARLVEFADHFAEEKKIVAEMVPHRDAWYSNDLNLIDLSFMADLLAILKKHTKAFEEYK